MKIQPFGDRIVVKVLLPEEKEEGSLLVTFVSKENSNQGKVVAIGEEVKLVSVGDTVLFNLGVGMDYSSNDEDYKILQIRDVLGKVL